MAFIFLRFCGYPPTPPLRSVQAYVVRYAATMFGALYVLDGCLRSVLRVFHECFTCHRWYFLCVRRRCV